MESCAFCSKEAAKRLCGSCACVAYCGDECARADWTRHWTDVHRTLASCILLTKIGEEEQEEPDNDYDEIPLVSKKPSFGRLYVGGVRALRHLDHLKVEAVITALPYDKRHISETRLAALIGNRAHMRLPWYDSVDQVLPFEKLCEAARFIHSHLSQGHNVLVHCAAGWSRSVSVIIFYMTHQGPLRGGESVEEALAHIQQARPSAGPNDGFIAQLKEYAKRACRLG